MIPAKREAGTQEDSMNPCRVQAACPEGRFFLS